MLWLKRDSRVGCELIYYGPDVIVPLIILRVTGIQSLVLWREVIRGRSINLLRKLPGLRGLTLLDFRLQDGNAIQRLSNLRKLKLITPFLKPAIDLTCLRELEYLSVEDASRIVRHIDSCVKLEALYASKLKEYHSLSDLNTLQNLTYADFSQPSFTCIGPANLPNLESLEFRAARHLTNLEGIEGCPNLKSLWLNGAPKLQSLEGCQFLRCLERVMLRDCGEIESLRPLGELPSLKLLYMEGNTRVKDGCISALLEAPKLEEVDFAKRGGYDMDANQLMKAIKERRRS